MQVKGHYVEAENSDKLIFLYGMEIMSDFKCVDRIGISFNLLISLSVKQSTM